ncbi:DNA-3-methyladenine glycosylase 2 family protein [Oculatella sp. LEGE 06141]|nr:DNA-3-methyladenine glycosylase 2 family protein [Oculatella sp. LEGE 06141]
MHPHLDPDLCYRAIQTKDARFDGQFFVAVYTTGIYCRPMCPATTPKRENCTFFASAAAAQQAGFRSCLRCRPELSPHLVAYVGTAVTVARALRLIGEGALDEGTVAELATRLGVGDRHLRQLFTKHLGTSPSAVAHARRLLFAKQLLDDTTLSMTDVAMAAGFSSIRRFNDVIQKNYGRSPTDLRRQTAQPVSTNTPTIALKLPFCPPYDWAALMRFLIPRATPGLEQASMEGYRRAIAIGEHHGIVEVRPVASQPYLIAHICFPDVRLLAQIVERLRRMFDLSAHIREIAAHFESDPLLAPVVAKQPGLRIPGAFDSFELGVRAILGQQVSVATATTLAGRLVKTYGEPLSVVGLPCPDPALRAVFPRPDVLATADLATLGITQSRARAIAAFAATTAAHPRFLTDCHSLESAVQTLCQLPGIGEWTAQYIAMRALGEPDAFPATDLGLLRSMAVLGHPVTKAQLADRSQAWRPWRAYAAMHLWSLTPAPPLTQPTKHEVLSA